ncbi:MAG: heat-inducible transcription repressor HrcA [Candidatus Marinimicrobia bacterium]|jgi:heat-inducible transcriptional repressor|nr:heat-inducible transcription repressor HrcA [Candidatus Neomarinimicrobiota bacterium]MBT3618123.1 heat-inducible transcription repressor HrcA [Candidatus Neomarinimicrobiota bacterium]MBT3828594.1 heat-inducible transcription repressor HrcA [Candidatus Neomarinimicrobiota bacterium]MBT3996944.1 heat-inducible transcription repressor HrcA [Candidatus Neomarinimicrobiota bacterium]MBT4280908.1 heat-inducible transcription repressor HrcA [Candidatus Neomarinimicrobiota bacterium]
MIDHKTDILLDREDVILKATIEDFIRSNSPIGSSFLKEQHHYSFSSATIRSTLSSLEEKGFLTHPYVSAGRIPTDLGYRLYVDDLMEPHPHTSLGKNEFIRDVETIATNMEELMRGTAVMLAKISKLFGVVVLKGYEKSTLSDIELVQIGSDRVMVVLAMKTGLVRSIVLNLKVDIGDRDLNYVNEALRNRLVGLNLKTIVDSIKSRLRDSDVFDHEIIQILLDKSTSVFATQNDAVVFTSSYSELLHQPEFQDAQLLQEILPALESDSLANDINLMDMEEWKAIIGGENENERLKNCSLISTPFNGNHLSGRLAILGPKRMRYSELKEILNQFASGIQNVC